MQKNVPYAAVVLIALGLILWLGWKFVIGNDDFIAYYLLDPERRDGDYLMIQRDIVDIREGVGRTLLLYWGGAALAALIWLIVSDRMSLPDPRAIGRPRWIWFSIFVGGAAAVALCGVLDLFGLSGVIAEGWPENVAVLFLLLYAIAYWPIGTLGFTSPALLPAVPLATRIR